MLEENFNQMMKMVAKTVKWVETKAGKETTEGDGL